MSLPSISRRIDLATLLMTRIIVCWFIASIALLERTSPSTDAKFEKYHSIKRH